MDDSDKDSEFDSEIEEIENEMYAKLYFIDTTPDTTVPQQNPLSNTTSSDSVSKDVKDVGGPTSLPVDEQDIIVTGDHRKPARDLRLNQNLLEVHQGCQIIGDAYLCSKTREENKPSSISLNVEKTKKTESSISQKGINEYAPLKISVTINTNVSESYSRTVTEVLPELDSDSKRGHCSDTNEDSILVEGKRKRVSSICSVDSISGNKPLDELYLCDDTEEPDSLDLGLKLALSKMEEELKKYSKTYSSKDTQKGKKRQREESESSDSDKEELKVISTKANNSENSQKLKKTQKEEPKNIQKEKREDSDNEEESKCQQMNSMKTKKDKKLSGDSDTVVLEDTSTDSDSSIYVLPPPEKRPCETVTLEDSGEENPCNQSSIHCMTEKNGSVKSKSKELHIKRSTKMPAISRGRKEASSDESSSEFEEDLNQSETNLSMNIDSRLADTLEKMSNELSQAEASTSLQSGSSDLIPLLRGNRTGTSKSLCSSQDVRQLTRKDAQNQTQVSSCAHWTAEMAAYYNTDIAEDLHVLDVHRSQSDLPQYWMIRNEDLPNKQKRRYFTKEVRCLRCRQFGHVKKDCPRVPRCHLCSETTHTVRHLCPNNCCFRCGKEPHMICPDTFVSTVCKMCGCKGHKTYLCPDYWRRYHLTTEGSNPILPLKPQYRSSVQAWCFVCAKKGHFGHQCPQRHLNDGYIPVRSIISSYDNPLGRKDGNQALNTENMDPEGGQEESFAVTILPARQQDGSRIMGKKGDVVKALQDKTRCTISFVSNVDNPQFRIYGTKQGRQSAERLIKMLLRTAPSKGSKEFLKKIAKLENKTTPSKPLPEGDAAYKKDTSFTVETTVRSNTFEKHVFINPRIYHIDFGEGNLTGVMYGIPNKRMALINRLKKDVERAANCEFSLLHALKAFMMQQVTTSKKTNKYSIAAFVRQYKRLAMILFGHKRVGDGEIFHKRSGALLQELERRTGLIVSKEHKREAAEILGMVFNPSVDKAESIVELARKQLGFSSELLKGIAKKRKNGNSKNLKTKASFRKRKKGSWKRLE